MPCSWALLRMYSIYEKQEAIGHFLMQDIGTTWFIPRWMRSGIQKKFAQCPSANLEEKLECHSTLLWSFPIQYFINNLYENIEDVPNKWVILEGKPAIIDNKILKTPITSINQITELKLNEWK